MPHVCLYVLLCLYLLAGAWAFARIEHNAERQQQAKKLQRIGRKWREFICANLPLSTAEIYEQIASAMGEECATPSAEGSLQFREGIYKSLGRVSQFIEGPQFQLSATDEPELDEVLPPRWNPMSSILYALSILVGNE
jgi:hypothetical protein